MGELEDLHTDRTNICCCFFIITMEAKGEGSDPDPRSPWSWLKHLRYPMSI